MNDELSLYNPDTSKRKSCFHCGGRLNPTGRIDDLGITRAQLYNCQWCGMNTRILEPMKPQTTMTDIPEPTLKESHDDPLA